MHLIVYQINSSCLAFSMMTSFQILVAKCFISASTDTCTNWELLLEFYPHHINTVVFFQLPGVPKQKFQTLQKYFFLTLVHEPICKQKFLAVLTGHYDRWQNSSLFRKSVCDSLGSIAFNDKVFCPFCDHYGFQQSFNGSVQKLQS